MPKKDRTLRLYINYRELNNITIKNNYLLLLILELQDRLQKTKWFIKLNILGAYNQIRIKKSNKWKTTFYIYYRYFKYLVIPFRLTNTPVIFQAFINNVLKKYLDVFIIMYLDNILIYSQTEEDHKQYIS